MCMVPYEIMHILQNVYLLAHTETFQAKLGSEVHPIKHQFAAVLGFDP